MKSSVKTQGRLDWDSAAKYSDVDGPVVVVLRCSAQWSQPPANFCFEFQLSGKRRPYNTEGRRHFNSVYQQ